MIVTFIDGENLFPGTSLLQARLRRLVLRRAELDARLAAIGGQLDHLAVLERRLDEAALEDQCAAAERLVRAGAAGERAAADLSGLLPAEE